MQKKQARIAPLDDQSGKWNFDSIWVSPPQQTRSLKSLEAVLEAATELFTTKGFRETTIQDISELSGVSTGSIYNRFSSKERILQVIHDSFANSVTTHMGDHAFVPGRWEDASAADTVMAIVDGIFYVFRTYPEISALIERQRRVNATVAERARKWDDFALKRYSEMLSAKKDEIPIDDVDETLGVMHYMVRESLAQTLVFDGMGLAPKFHINDNDFRRDMMRMGLRCFELPDETPRWTEIDWPRFPGW